MVGDSLTPERVAPRIVAPVRKAPDKVNVAEMTVRDVHRAAQEPQPE